MAKMAQGNKPFTGAKRLAAAIQKLLRNIGLNKLEAKTDAEAMDMLNKARLFIRKGMTKAKMLERSLVGKNVGQDFFPTPKATAEETVDKADISEGMDILEPSAGNGNIAEAIRDAGANPEAVIFLFCFWGIYRGM